MFKMVFSSSFLSVYGESEGLYQVVRLVPLFLIPLNPLPPTTSRLLFEDALMIDRDLVRQTACTAVKKHWAWCGRSRVANHNLYHLLNFVFNIFETS
jgi:hypothetical protein